MGEMQENREESGTQKKLSKKVWFAILTMTVIIAALAVGIGIYNSPVNRLSRQLNLGQKYLLEQNYEQAIVEFDKAIAIDPMNAEAYFGRAKAYIGAENYEQAISDLTKVMEIEPANAEAYLELADIYIVQEDLEKALEICQLGYEQTGDSRLQSKIEEIRQKIGEKKAEQLRREEEEKKEQLKLEARKREEEISKVTSACGSDFLTYEYKRELSRSVVEFLEHYRECCPEDYVTWQFLRNIYLGMGEMERCAEVCRQMYELGDTYSSPDGYSVTNADGTAYTANGYGQTLYTKQGDTEHTFTYGDDGKMISNYMVTHYYNNADGSESSRQEDDITYQYDAEGRLSEVRSVTLRDTLSAMEDYPMVMTATYEYHDNGYTIHSHTEQYDAQYRITTTSESHHDYVIDEYGAIVSSSFTIEE